MLMHNLLISLQPRRVLIGGGVAVARPRLIDAVRARAFESLANYYTAAFLDGDWLTKPGLGSSAGPLGALAIGLAATGQ
jgi:fructokinase